MKKDIFLSFLVSILILPVQPKGKWEFGLHYSFWNIDILSPLIEDNLTPDFENYDPDKGNFNFNSNGNNFGFEIRYFPSGKRGSFSIGFSYERNNFKAKIDGQYEDVIDHYSADISGAGTFKLLPHSFNVSMRWELWPRTRVHPYIGIGIGIGPLNGGFTLKVIQTIHKPGGDEIVEHIKEEKTMDEALEDLEQEGNSFPLRVIPIVHVYFGVRGEVITDLYALGEFAIYNGIIFRLGIAYRF